MKYISLAMIAAVAVISGCASTTEDQELVVVEDRSMIPQDPRHVAYVNRALYVISQHATEAKKDRTEKKIAKPYYSEQVMTHCGLETGNVLEAEYLRRLKFLDPEVFETCWIRIDGYLRGSIGSDRRLKKGGENFNDVNMFYASAPYVIF
jgi:hypothetical protein